MSLRSTLRNPAVWFGTVGSVAVALGGTNGEYSFATTGWPQPTVQWLGGLFPPPFDGILIVLGAVLLTWSWWRIRPRKGVEPAHAGITLTLWSLPLLLVPPVLSNDAYLYADLGWSLLHGHNPYLVGLATTGSPFAAQVDPLWAGSGVAYPPLALWLHAAVVALSGADPYWSVIAMRVPVLISVAVMGVLLPRIADLLGRHRRRAVWLGLLNPLLVLHLIGAAHNDAPMIALSLVAIWLVLKYRTAWVSLLAAPAVVGIAMAFKQQAGLTVLAVAGLPVAAQLAKSSLPARLGLLARRTAIATAVAVTTFVAACLASGLGFGWAAWLDLMGKASTPAPLSMISKGLAWIVGQFGGDTTAFLTVAGAVGTGIMVVALGWVIVRFADRPLAALAWGSLVVAVLGQALHPWYLPWSLALLALVPLTQRQRRLVYGLSLAFAVWNAFQTVVWHGKP